jgi:hypothetical protein
MKTLIALAVLLISLPAAAAKLKTSDARIRFEDARTQWKVKVKTCNKGSSDSDAVYYEIRLFQLAEPVSPSTQNWKIARWTDAVIPAGQCQTEDMPVTVDTGSVPPDTYHVVLWVGEGSDAGRKRYTAKEHYIKSN